MDQGEESSEPGGATACGPGIEEPQLRNSPILTEVVDEPLLTRLKTAGLKDEDARHFIALCITDVIALCEAVMLFGTLAEAEMLKSFIDSTGCGESCRRDHLAVELRFKRRPTLG